MSDIPTDMISPAGHWVATVFRSDGATGCSLPLAGERIAAGFPSPADDYVEKRLDLNEHLVQRPEATFFVRVAGDSMIGAGIHDGDILVVDRSVRARSGHVVVAALNGEFTVKRLREKDGTLLLAPENPDYPPLAVSPETDFEVWGVVRHVIHEV